MQNQFTSFLIISGLMVLGLVSMPGKAMEGSLKRSRGELIVSTNAQNGAILKSDEFNKALKQAAKKIDADGNTALHGAALEGDADITQKLLNYGADPLLQNTEGQTALHLAAMAPSCDVAQVLINGVSQKEKRKRIFTILCLFNRYQKIIKSNIPKDVRCLLFSYLPTLATGSANLCKRLVPKYITEAQIRKRYNSEQRNLFALKLLELKDTNDKTAHDIAVDSRRGMMARMTKPANLQKQHARDVKNILNNFVDTENKEN